MPAGSGETSPWFPSVRRRTQARVRLFCFPFAGGGASAFRDWPDLLPEWIEVWPVEYPGHESRFRESAFTDAASLANAISAELAAVLDRPFAFFGHSMGALLAFETARVLQQRGLSPSALFVSGYGDPRLAPARGMISGLPERSFREELRLYGGTPDEVLANEELMQILSPIVRRDLQICERFGYSSGPKLDFPIIAFGGTEDPTVPWHRLLGWSDHTRSGFRTLVVPGGHFFVRKAAAWLCRTITHYLENPFALSKIEIPAAEEIHLWRVRLALHDAPALAREAVRTLLEQYGSLAMDAVDFAWSGEWALITVRRDTPIRVAIHSSDTEVDHSFSPAPGYTGSFETKTNWDLVTFRDWAPQ